jgi:hypothetical protein
MRTLTALALSLAALVTALVTTADAKPRHHRKPSHDSKWMRDCIAERTGPDGGVSPVEARKICTAEQPEDEIADAKAQLAIARGNAKVRKAQERVQKALLACEQAVTDRCVDTAPADGSADCNTEQGLRAEYELVCLGVKGGK